MEQLAEAVVLPNYKKTKVFDPRRSIMSFFKKETLKLKVPRVKGRIEREIPHGSRPHRNKKAYDRREKHRRRDD